MHPHWQNKCIRHASTHIKGIECSIHSLMPRRIRASSLLNTRPWQAPSLTHKKRKCPSLAHSRQTSASSLLNTATWQAPSSPHRKERALYSLPHVQANQCILAVEQQHGKHHHPPTAKERALYSLAHVQADQCILAVE
eukprot:337036-Pelagomonas_calceolata.AAC.1